MLVEPRTGQWFVSSEGTRWWFDPGSISLDFAYTGAMGDNPDRETWHRPADASAWFAERYGVRVRLTRDDLARARKLRAAVATLTYDALAGRDFTRSAAHLLDRWARQPDVAPQLARPPRATLDTVLATLARDAVVMLRDSGDRIRECGADDCFVVYLDASRSANRTWCSMQRCGNRHKVRRIRARRRASATAPTEGETA